MPDFDKISKEPFVLPRDLTRPYTGNRYVSREPFLMNPLVDDMQTLTGLRDFDVDKNQIFMGIAGFRALDILACTGRDVDDVYHQAILFDNNETQVKAMNGVLHFAAEHKTPEAFREAFTREYLRWVDYDTPQQPEKMPPRSVGKGLIKEPWKDEVPTRNLNKSIIENMRVNPSHPQRTRRAEDKEYFAQAGRGYIPETPESVAAYFEHAAQNTNSWLHPKNYQRIHELAVRGRIATATLDLTDRERFKILKNEVFEKKYKLGQAYLSTSLMYLVNAGQLNYHAKASAEETPTNNSLLTGYENITSLGSTNSYYLISQEDKGEEERAPDKTCSLVVGNATQLGTLCEKWSREIGSPDFKNSGSVFFATGKRTCAAMWTRAEISPQLNNWIMSERPINANDYLLEISAQSPPVFSDQEINALVNAVIPLGVRYNCPDLIDPVEGFNDNKIDLLVFRIPEKVVNANPKAPTEIANALQSALKVLGPLRSR